MKIGNWDASDILKNLSHLLQDVSIVLGFAVLQCGWLSLRIAPKAGLINFLPTLLCLGLWYLFIKTTYSPRQFWVYFLPAVVLTLRLPISLASWLEPLNWVAFVGMAILIFQPIVLYFQRQQRLILALVAAGIVLFNTVGHLSLNSPYTYTFRTANGLASNYKGVDNNQTWECPYEQAFYAVNCDMRHFVVSEKVFINPDSKAASFSVLLSRFWYGYLSSLVGFEGRRWLASLLINYGMWVLACFSIYRICELTCLKGTVAEIALLCAASSWGFIHVVAQPSPHLMAYAYTAYALWAAIEILRTQERRRITFLVMLIGTGSIAYQVYPVTLTCLVLLVRYRRWAAAIGIVAIEIVASLFWQEISLRRVLGTLGAIQDNSSGSQNIVHDFKTWQTAIQTFDLARLGQLVAKAGMAYTFGSLGIGVVAAIVWLVWQRRQSVPDLESPIAEESIDAMAEDAIADEPEKEGFLWGKPADILWLTCCSLCIFTFATTLFIVPQMAIWSPMSGTQPRLAYFSYPANTISIAALAAWFLPAKFRYAPAVATFLCSNLDTTGAISVAMLFDFGLSGWYLK